VETWPLVGRQRELQRLREALTTTETGGAVVAGLPGVGKTRLAREAVEQVREHVPVVEWVMATQAASRIPFGPMAHLLPAQTHGGGTRLDLLRQISERLAARAGGGRVVLGVDDAHLLDDASAALVHHLVTTAVAVVAMTVHAGAATADAVTALWKDRYVDWIEVRPFRRAEFDEVLTGVLGGQVEGSTAQQLWTLSQGNALLLRELVTSMQEGGVLARRSGMWRISGQVVPDARLAETVWARLGRLSGDLREVAEVVAHGEPLGAWLLESIVSGPAFRAAERANLLEIDRHDDRRTQIRLVHPLYGELLRATTPPLRARMIRRRLAEALERTGGRRADDLLRLAVWRLDGGGPPDADLFTRAARQASGRFFDHALAERLASAAVDAGGGWRARRVLAEAISAQGRAAEAEALLAELDREAVTDERARVAVTRASNLFWGLGRSTAAEQVLLNAGAADSGSLDEPAVLRAIIALSRGRTEGALAIVAPLLDSPDPSSPPSHAYLGAAAIATGAWAFAGRAEHAITLARRTLDAATRDDPVTALPIDRLLTALCIAYRLAGRLSDAEELAAEGYRDAVGRHAQDLQATWALMLGENALARGDLGMAIPMLRESAGLLSERAWFFGVYSRAWCLGSLSEALALAGEVDAAQAALAEADAVGPDEFFIPNRERGRTWVAVAGGDTSTGLTVAEHAAGLAGRLGSHLVAADALHDLARLGQAAAVAVPLGDLAIWTESRLVPAYAAHARALAVQDGDALDAAAASFAEVGTNLLAAEAAAEASRVHQRGGQRAKAAASAERVSRFVGGIPPPRTPALQVPHRSA
jgi:tetratricopeptide (TPR) repeat protein